MYKFSANLGLLWTEMSQIDAIYKAKDKGFDAVEFQFPYQYDSREIKKALDDVNLPVMGINTIKGNIEKPYFQIFFGTKMPLDKARESFVWPMQQIVGEKPILVTFVKQKVDSESQWNKLEEKGITEPWISFKIPYIIPLTLAFFATAFFGDLFSTYLVEPINSFFD